MCTQFTCFTTSLLALLQRTHPEVAIVITMHSLNLGQQDRRSFYHRCVCVCACVCVCVCVCVRISARFTTGVCVCV
jgi:hypothetical protein